MGYPYTTSVWHLIREEIEHPESRLICGRHYDAMKRAASRKKRAAKKLARGFRPKHVRASV